MDILKHLNEDRNKLRQYFEYPEGFIENSKRNPDEWLEEYFKKYRNNRTDHDEPWLTLMALYSVFGAQPDAGKANHAQIINDLFSSSKVIPTIKSVTNVCVEVILPEIAAYRKHLYEKTFSKGAYHPYPDVNERIAEKLKKKTASIEGNTNLDALICGLNSNEKKQYIFIEAKFLSDISKDTSYNTARDQIIRNIDAAIDKVGSVDHFWFFLLTPGIFRTESFIGAKDSPIKEFKPERSRLYCYKMEEYLNWENLKAMLPHRAYIPDRDWKTIANNIGWVTFEDFNRVANKYIAVPNEEVAMLNNFFKDRQMTSNK